MYSAYKLNKQDLNIQPWHTPYSTPVLIASIVSSTSLWFHWAPVGLCSGAWTMLALMHVQLWKNEQVRDGAGHLDQWETDVSGYTHLPTTQQNRPIHTQRTSVSLLVFMLYCDYIEMYPLYSPCISLWIYNYFKVKIRWKDSKGGFIMATYQTLWVRTHKHLVILISSTCLIPFTVILLLPKLFIDIICLISAALLYLQQIFPPP